MHDIVCLHLCLYVSYRMSAGQYCYVNVPWISHTQWHPFSIMPETRADGKQGARYDTLYSIYYHDLITCDGIWQRSTDNV